MAKRRKRKAPQKPELVRQDGALCATLVNTANAKRESLESYADLLVWSQQNGVLGATDAQRLERAAAERPDDADAVFRRAQELRASLERILLALIAHQAPAAADLDAVSIMTVCRVENVRAPGVVTICRVESVRAPDVVTVCRVENVRAPDVVTVCRVENVRKRAARPALNGHIASEPGYCNPPG